MHIRILVSLLVVFSLELLVCFEDAWLWAQERRNRRLERQISRYRRGLGTGANRSPNYFTVGAGVGFNNYFGDLSANSGISTQFNTYNTYVGAQVLYRFSPNFQLNFGLARLRLTASDADVNQNVSASYQGRYIRNLHFRNDFWDFTARLEANLFPVDRGALKRPYLNPYVFSGLTFFTNNPQAKGPENTTIEGQWTDLQPIKTEANGLAGGSEAYSTFQLAFPLGAGVRFKIANDFDVGFELGYRMTFTNYMDDVGRQYIINFYQDLSLVQQDVLRHDPMAVRFNNRTAERYDSYGNLRRIGGKTIDELIEDGRMRRVFLRDGSTFYYYPGFENGGSVRGKPAPDLYLSTAVYLYYVIPSRQQKFRRRR